MNDQMQIREIKSELTINDLINQVALIQHAMKAVMRKDEHYGIIPGTGDKPTLLKPGAEKLCLLFRFAPEYEIMPESQSTDRFIRYLVRCNLKHIPTSSFVGSGIGACNTRETKYRYRSESTGRPVPKEYWDTRDPEILGGTRFKARKKSTPGGKGEWVIYESVEHDNPWDFENTIVKMAEKRALVAALLNATAASDIFTQDLEDLKANEALDSTFPATKPRTPPPETPRSRQPEIPVGGSPPIHRTSLSGAELRGIDLREHEADVREMVEPPPAESWGSPSETWWPDGTNQKGELRRGFLKVQQAAIDRGLTKEEVEAYALSPGRFKNRNGKEISKMAFLSNAQLEGLTEDVSAGAIAPKASKFEENIPF